MENYNIFKNEDKANLISTLENEFNNVGPILLTRTVCYDGLVKYLYHRDADELVKSKYDMMLLISPVQEKLLLDMATFNNLRRCTRHFTCIKKVK